MKTLSLTIPLCAAAIVAAILAPTSTSGTTELQRLGLLEDQMIQVQDAIAILGNQANCERTAMSVTSYAGADGKTYLAATRSAKHRRVWLLVMTPACTPKHPTRAQMKWGWSH